MRDQKPCQGFYSFWWPISHYSTLEYIYQKESPYSLVFFSSKLDNQYCHNVYYWILWLLVRSCFELKGCLSIYCFQTHKSLSLSQNISILDTIQSHFFLANRIFVPIVWNFKLSLSRSESSRPPLCLLMI